MAPNFTSTPLPRRIVDGMAASGLRISLLDTTDAPVFETWVRAMARGFHEPNPDPAAMTAERISKEARRITGVWEAAAATTDEPVGTVSSWSAEVTVSPGRVVSAWAISSVTVASTHRRRGIARALLEAELHIASDLCLPLAILTVSESTIYGRFGFAPAAFVSTLSLETHRAAMVGSAPDGRVSFVSLEHAREALPGLHDRSRVEVPGQIVVCGGRWNELSGRDGADTTKAKSLRAVRYEDSEGVVQGLALYRVTIEGDDFTKHVLHLEYLVSATSDAYSALWRFLLSVDLVSQVRAQLRSSDEPLRWMLADQRSLTEVHEDHLWVRILDVPAALEARSYNSDGRISLEVSDDHGYAAGRYLMTVTDGVCAVERIDGDFAQGASVLTLTVNELSSLYLGGVSATTLERAGRLSSSANAAAIADAVFRASVTP